MKRMSKCSWLILLILINVTPNLFGQHTAIRDDGKKIILFENKTWTFADSTKPDPANHSKRVRLEIPKLKPGDEFIEHTGFTLLYNEQHEQAAWVAYELTAEETEKKFDRTDRFMVDPKVKTGTADDMDYKGSGYDRGHLAPASDMGWSLTTMAESFYYSNMSPQAASCNRGIWKRGEDQVRKWAVEYHGLYVVTGPVLTPNLETIGPNKVSVPKLYYKVLLDYKEKGAKGIGFLVPNEGSTDPLSTFAVSIDSVQKVTGIDFFPSLPAEQEKVLEKSFCLECWSWSSKAIRSSGNPKGNGSSKFSQCQGINADGSHCKNNIVGGPGFCIQHNTKK